MTASTTSYVVTCFFLTFQTTESHSFSTYFSRQHSWSYLPLTLLKYGVQMEHPSEHHNWGELEGDEQPAWNREVEHFILLTLAVFLLKISVSYYSKCKVLQEVNNFFQFEVCGTGRITTFPESNNKTIKSQNHRIPGWKWPQGSPGPALLGESTD